MEPRSDTRTYGRVTVEDGTFLGDFVVLGYPDIPRLRRAQDERVSFEDAARDVDPTAIGARAMIGSNVVIHEGASVGSRVIIDDYCRIGARASIGDRTRVIYGADIRHDARVGSDCVIGGFICDRADVGSETVVLGSLVHKLDRPDLPWGVDEESPVIRARAVVGVGAVVVGGIEIGANSYVAAGAVVTKNLPPRTLALRYNEFVPRDQWTGAMRQSPFWTWGDPTEANDA